LSVVSRFILLETALVKWLHFTIDVMSAALAYTEARHEPFRSAGLALRYASTLRVAGNPETGNGHVGGLRHATKAGV
jgi:hypothetical protein